MLEVFLWIMAITIAISAMIVTAAMELHTPHFALGMVIAAFIAVTAIRDHQNAAEANADKSRLAAIIIRHMGMFWAWAALSIFITYALMIQWSQIWVGIFMVLALGSAVCLFMANTLQRDSEAGTEDVNAIALVGLIAKLQVVVTCLIVGSLVAFGRFNTQAFGGEAKWAAVNILLCTAMGAAILSGFAITTGRKPRTAAPVAAVKHETPSSRPRRRRTAHSV
jgi:hypothetical protein